MQDLVHQGGSVWTGGSQPFQAQWQVSCHKRQVLFLSVSVVRTHLGPGLGPRRQHHSQHLPLVDSICTPGPGSLRREVRQAWGSIRCGGTSAACMHGDPRAGPGLEECRSLLSSSLGPGKGCPKADAKGRRGGKVWGAACSGFSDSASIPPTRAPSS